MEFNKKVNNLLSGVEPPKNQFVAQGLKESNVTTSGNGAKKYSTSGNSFVDNFAAIAMFKKPRPYAEVAKDMELLWSQDPQLCVKLALYIRLITRKTRVVERDEVEVLEVQRGQGLKNEGIMRMLWLAIHHKPTFKANFSYFIAAGSWKDVFQMLSLDLQYHGWDHRKLDWNFFYLVIAAGLNNPESTHLVRKYMPTIRTNGNCKTLESQADTLVGRWLANKLCRLDESWDKATVYKAYRKVKVEGIAHQWQQLISKKLFDAINFDYIAGRALSLLVGSKFLKNHNLIGKYSAWIQSKPTAKYTGFVFELFQPLGDGARARHIEDYREATINAQFAQLVKTGKEGVNTNSRLLVVRDTSGSMTSMAIGCNMSSFGIAKAMALYFSEFLTGAFENTFVEFNTTAKMHQWKGNTPCDKWVNDTCYKVGNTNFQSVIDLFIDLKNQHGVPESDFPTGILCISDGEFDRSGDNKSTNFQRAITRLREAGFSEEYVSNFKIILWDIPNHFYGGKREVKFEDFADAPNFFYLSGYDPAAVAFILGTKPFKSSPRTAEELFLASMDQELLNRVQIVEDKRPQTRKKNFKKKK